MVMELMTVPFSARFLRHAFYYPNFQSLLLDRTLHYLALWQITSVDVLTSLVCTEIFTDSHPKRIAVFMHGGTQFFWLICKWIMVHAYMKPGYFLAWKVTDDLVISARNIDIIFRCLLI